MAFSGWILGLVAVLCCRLVMVLPRFRGGARRHRQSARVMAVLGSGGHTAELLRAMEGLGEAYRPRTYVVAETDGLSRSKAEQFERGRGGVGGGAFRIATIPRARQVWGRGIPRARREGGGG